LNCDKLNQEIVQKIQDKEKEKITNILKFYEYERDNLISILQDIQEYYGYLPSEIIFYISERLKIPPAEILSVATFYTQFNFKERGKYTIVCCEGTACHVNGAPLILNFIENKLGIKAGETTKDKMFSIKSVACLGCCAISPVCVINGQIYGDLTLKKMSKILKNLVKAEK